MAQREDTLHQNRIPLGDFDITTGAITCITNSTYVTSRNTNGSTVKYQTLYNSTIKGHEHLWKIHPILQIS